MAVSSSNQNLKHRIYEGFKEYLIITLYLWVLFALFELYKSVLVSQYHIDVVAKSFAVINALALAKIALLAREFKLDERLRPKGSPLIYPTLINAAAFSLLLFVFKLVEEAAVGLYHGKSLAESISAIGGGSWRGLLCLAIIFFVMLIPFCAFTELGVALGGDRLARFFFREHPKSFLSKVSE